MTKKKVRRLALDWIEERLDNIYPQPIEKIDLEQLTDYIFKLLEHNDKSSTTKEEGR